ncbi:MAG: hypothetical protein OXF75_04940 [Acidimicrobiaceae bacterium]|nr:hypothetical protein [Acidimicrobiaceae bacterium]
MTESTTPLIDEPTSAISVSTPHIDQLTRLSPDVMANFAGALRQDVGLLSQDVARVHGDSLDIQLESRTDEAAKRAPADLLSELADLGFSWTAIARIVGVSIPAIRKWRHGEPTTGENRRSLAKLVALVGVLENDHLISDVASWLDIPLAESNLTGIDVLADGRIPDLVEYAAQHIGSTELLDRTLPAWRDSLDGQFEVYRAGDDERAIRMRSEDGTG